MKRILATIRHRRSVRAITLNLLVGLMVAVAVVPAYAQTPAPAAPTNLVTDLTDNEGEVRLTWDAAEGATQYGTCQRVQTPAGDWTCATRNTTTALFTGLTVGTVYDFAVASYDGETYSAWVWAEQTVSALTAYVCPITGLAIPEGYLEVNESTTSTGGRTFTLTGITRKSTITLSGTQYNPVEGRQWLKVCGTVTAPSDSQTSFWYGTDNNLSTDLGTGFGFFDHSVTDWLAVGDIPAGETRSACDIWDAATVIYAVNNFQENPGVYRVDLPAN